MVLFGLLIDGGHCGMCPSQKLGSRQPLSSRHLSPNFSVHAVVQHGPCDGLQLARGVSVHGFSSEIGRVDIGKQHVSLQSSSQPQSHSSPGSTTPLPHMACCGSEKIKHKTKLRCKYSYLFSPYHHWLFMRWTLCKRIVYAWLFVSVKHWTHAVTLHSIFLIEISMCLIIFDG